MTWLVVCAVAAVASALTLVSGFGLGTLLMPAFAAFFPLPVAIAATALVHLAKNLSSLIVARAADRAMLWWFGLPSVIAAAAGAWTLTAMSSMPRLAAYHVGTHAAEITPVKLVLGAVIIAFALLDMLGVTDQLTIPRRWLPIGGLASGYFGGLSGHQGALRSAFLTHAGMTKEAFVATNVVISVAVDVVRLAAYGLAAGAGRFAAAESVGWPLLAAACASSLVGTLVGARIVRKATIRAVRLTVAIMLLLAGALLAAGLI